MKPKPAVFSRENLCTKRHIWNCFRCGRGFAPVQLAIAESQIGMHVPKDMIVQKRLTIIRRGESECYELTKLGIDWINKGIVGYLRKHPDEIKDTRPLPYRLLVKLN